MIPTLLFLKWAHIIAMVYWLGGEWGGVFQTSYHVTNPRLPLEERRRHMETAYWIDILARLGNIPLLPIGLHMATCGATRDPLKRRLHQPRSARAVPRLTAIA